MYIQNWIKFERLNA